MPDTKSGIKHLSNLAQMHHNICLSLQGFYKKQFKSNMKVYTKEMNHIKEDLTKLRSDKDKYQKQDAMHKKAMNLSVTDTASADTIAPLPPQTRDDAHEQLRRRSHQTNKALTNKVQEFSQRLKSRAWSASTIHEDQEETTNTKSQRTAESENQGSYGQPDHQNTQEDADEDSVFEKDTEHSQKSRHKIQAMSRSGSKAVTTIPTPTFKNDKYVNSTVNTARSKLSALYQQAVIGPASFRKRVGVTPSPPSRPNTAKVPSHRAGHKSLQQRSQSSLGINKPQPSKPSTQRNVKSAQPKLRQAHARRTEAMRAGSSTSLASVTFEDEEREAEAHHRKRQRKLNEIKEALTTRYQEFEEALHRRMLIRDMKAAEYDANHRATGPISVHEILPSNKGTAISAAFRRQSALIALERSYIYA